MRAPEQSHPPQAPPGSNPRFNIVQFVRGLPIRWRILAIAGVNAAVVLILAGLIWNGAQDLSRAWNDVRKVRESDKVLAILDALAR